MNVGTGHMYDGAEAIKEAKDRGEPLLRIPELDIEKVRAMTMGDRKSYANRVLKRRKQSKARRKANRKRRGRR